GADPGMQNEGAGGRNREDVGFQNELATRDDQIRPEPGEKVARLCRVGVRHDDPGNVPQVTRIRRAETRYLLGLPSSVAMLEAEAGEQTERGDVQKSEDPDTPK